MGNFFFPFTTVSFSFIRPLPGSSLRMPPPPPCDGGARYVVPYAEYSGRKGGERAEVQVREGDGQPGILHADLYRHRPRPCNVHAREPGYRVSEHEPGDVVEHHYHGDVGADFRDRAGVRGYDYADYEYYGQ